jgi:cephalosporin hydroxylase
MGNQSFIKVLGRQFVHAVDVLRGEGLNSLVSKSLRSPGVIVRTTRCRRRLRDRKSDLSIEQHVDFAMDFKDIAPFQIRSELVRMLEVVQKARPRTIVEIGTANGGTLFLFCCVAEDDGTLISLDLPGGRFGGGYSAWRVPLYQDFARKRQKIHLLRGDSHSDETLKGLMSILAGRQVDFLFIDGDHTCEGVRRDFELYSPLVAKGGLIGFHDIAPLGPAVDYGVRRLWDELKPFCEWQEIIADPNQHGFGIGLLRK